MTPPGALRGMMFTMAALLASSSTRAAEPEKVVVRNRLFTTDGRWEGSASAGFALSNKLTEHTNFTASLGYHLTEQFALELAGGWAQSRQTGVADTLRESAIKVRSEPGSQTELDDFRDLWQMTWNATAALRWAPIYGKLSVVGELPVHFKAFVLAGAGAGGMKRDSVVSFTDSAFTPLHESATKPLFVGGVGMHFFLTQWAGLRIEVRDVAFPDSYRERIILQPSEGAASEGKPAGSPGLTNLVFVQVGAVFSI